MHPYLISMKKGLSVPLFLFLTLFYSCNDEAPVENTPGKLVIAMKPIDAESATRSKAQDAPEAILISIESANSNELVYDLEEIKLVKLGDSFLSQAIELPTGNYRITRFLVVGSDDKVLYATPLEGSDLAHLVSEPLPMVVSVQKNATVEVLMEAVSVDEGVQPSDLGYATFALNLIKHKKLLVLTSIAKEGGDSEPVNGTFEVQAKNLEGNVLWTQAWPISKTKEIVIPVTERYTFILSKAGHIPHIQHYQYKHIESVNTLSFELIPEGSDDFIVEYFDLAGSTITAYFPTDKGKIYTRVDLPKDSDIQPIYLYIDCGASTFTGYPLSPFFFKEVVMNYPDELDGSVNFVSSAVNLFDNLPFAKSLNLRDIVVLGSANFTKEFDRDVVVERYFLADRFDGLFKDHFIRSFDKQKFLDYWCGQVYPRPPFCEYLSTEGDKTKSEYLQSQRESVLSKSQHLLHQ